MGNENWEGETHKFYVKHNIISYSPHISFKSSIQENASALSCFKDRMATWVGPLYVKPSSLICLVAWTHGISLCLVETTKVWSGRMTGYSMVIRMGLCFLTAGMPNGIWPLSSLPIIATLFFPIKTANSSTCFIVAAAKQQLGFFFLSIDWVLQLNVGNLFMVLPLGLIFTSWYKS